MFKLDLITAIIIVYFFVDFWTMTKYLDQIKSIMRSKRVVGSARKYFFKAIIREIFFLTYCVVILHVNVVLMVLSVISLILNAIILCLMIEYKKIKGKRDWEDRVYDWIKYTILRRFY